MKFLPQFTTGFTFLLCLYLSSNDETPLSLETGQTTVILVGNVCFFASVSVTAVNHINSKPSGTRQEGGRRFDFKLR